MFGMGKSTSRRGCLVAVAAFVAGCSYLVVFQSSDTTEAPRVIGIRKDAHGVVLQKFVIQCTTRERGWFPSPRGPAPLSVTSRYDCFIREPGKSDQPLPFLRDMWLNVWDCKPIANSPFWVMQTSLENNSHKTRILAFDDSRILRNVTLPLTYSTSGPGGPWFREGNRKVIYRTTGGFEQYDIVTGVRQPCAKPVQLPEDDHTPWKLE
jgi:hypothetical protein